MQHIELARLAAALKAANEVMPCSGKGKYSKNCNQNGTQYKNYCLHRLCHHNGFKTTNYSIDCCYDRYYYYRMYNTYSKERLKYDSSCIKAHSHMYKQSGQYSHKCEESPGCRAYLFSRNSGSVAILVLI